MKRLEWTAGDDNVARLLAQPYDPPTASAAFAARVQARLLEVAAERARTRPAKPRRRRWVALAAVLALFALGVRLLPRPVVSTPIVDERQASAALRTPPVALGARIATKPGERRRIALADGSVLSLNENTVVHHDAPRHLHLQTGEIFVEVAPQHLGKTAAPFTVATPHREVQAVGTKFLVSTGDEGTGVAVAQGHVRLNDWNALLSAGQQLTPQANAVTPTPRLSHLLDWTRDLVVADSPQLVPVSTYTGGALVAVDPQGKDASLSLRKYHIDVHIEDGFARTTIDQTYFNHTLGRLEGTFYFPLHADASLSRLAMYVDGQLMEGGMVERDYGRMVFDRIVTKMKDPALLEWVDGHTFKMRVFPLEARQEKRIILSYTQRLPKLYGRSTYRFPTGHNLGTVKNWSFHVVMKNGGQCAWHCDSHTLKPRVDANNDLLLDASAQGATLDRDLVLKWKESSASEPARFSTVVQDGFRYLMLRYRPQLPGLTKRQRRDWVFLFESSAERNPLLARTQIEIVRTLLNNAEPDDTFAILTADTQVRAFTPSPLATTPENVATALAFLEKAHLLGALDLDAGLSAAAQRLNRSEHPVLVHLGSGNAVLGERRAEVLANRLPQRASYVGIGVGKRWNRSFMHRAAERCQGYVTEINPDEAVAWRAFDLLATLNTPRLTQVRVTDTEDKTPFLCPSSFVTQGEELCAVCRLPVDAPLPQSVCLRGSLDHSPFCEHLPHRSPRPNAAYLPRTWARLEVDRLLAEDAVKNKQAIIALSKAMYVMTPYTSLLVLENEAMYAQYKVDRGRKDHWAMYPCPEKIPVVYEPPTPNERIQMDAADGLDQEHNELGFFPPALVLKVKGGGGIHTRPSNLIINAENNQRGFFPPAMALKVKGTSTIHTRPSNFIVAPNTATPYMMQPSGGGGSLAALADAGFGYGLWTARTGTHWMMNPYQGYLQNAADITRANANRQNTIRQARLIREEERTSVSQGRRPRIEEAEWERGHMPDPEYLRQRVLERQLAHARVSPPLTDIWSARALNALLFHLIEQQRRGNRGRNGPLGENIVEHINVTAADSSGNVGILKSKGDLQWPMAFQTIVFKEVREKISAEIKAAYRDVASGHKPHEAASRALRGHLHQMKELLETHAHNFTLDEVLTAMRYLRSLQDSIKSLNDPDLAKSLPAIEKPKARTVADLVRWMREKRLEFAAATPGDEAAYVALYHALRTFDAAMPQTTASLSLEVANTDPQEAEQLFASLIFDPRKTKRAALWRQATRIVEQRNDYEAARQHLCRALELDRTQPRDLLSLRRDYAWFLRLSQQCVHALISQRRPVPRALLTWVMAIADQWRAVDPQDGEPCEWAGRILCLAGERESAWSYFTSPQELQHGNAAAWRELALRLNENEDYSFAERAFAVAASLEPNNADIIRKRAKNRQRLDAIQQPARP